MIWVAISLGFFGSLHCLGMCGPLALGVSQFSKQSWWSSLFFGLQYNFGRVVTYMCLGAIFGLIGEVVFISGVQKAVSIISGSLLILLFLFSLDIEKLLSKSKWYQSSLAKLASFIQSSFINGAKKYPFLVGNLNGLLPCGLVYLALAGSLVSGDIAAGAAFMFAFGLGTFPAMLSIMLMNKSVQRHSIIKRLVTKRILPALHLLIGLFLIYRGFVVDVPMQLDFWNALNHPVMCH